MTDVATKRGLDRYEPNLAHRDFGAESWSSVLTSQFLDKFPCSVLIALQLVALCGLTNAI